MAKRNELRNQVEHCLENFPETRDSDVTLTIKIWKEYYPQRLRESADGKTYVALPHLYDLPREDNVKRVRAKFQNDLGLYLPTSLKVAKQRRINEEDWRNYVRNFPVTAPKPPEKQCPHGLPLLVSCPNCQT